jgi:polyhydroxybutyrate depolymerase
MTPFDRLDQLIGSQYGQTCRELLWLMVAVLFWIGNYGPGLLGSTDAKDSMVGARQAGWHERSIRIGEQERWFRVYVPKTLARQASVVLVLHGGTQSMRKVFHARSGGTRAWLELADREGLLLLAPNGANADNGDTKGDRQNWNDLRPGLVKSEADDVGFIRHLLDWTEANYDVDSRRFYVTGASNGGVMTFRLLIEMPARFAAGVAFVANLPENSPLLQPPERPTPLMIANGTRDPLMKWEGGEIPGKRGKVLSTEKSVAWWVQSNKADAFRSTTETLPDSDPADGCRIHRTLYPPKPGGATVQFYRIEGGGHTLPSARYAVREGWILRRLIGPQCKDAEGVELA